MVLDILSRIFRREKKEEKEKPEEEEVKETDLELICAGDREAYEALRGTMFLDPRTIEESMKGAAKKAKEFEKSGDMLRARICYQTAGGLAIHRGDVGKVKQFFGKCKQLSPKGNYKILEIPERAVKKAQEYYQKHSKAKEEK